MKKKINKMMILIATVTILLTMVLITVVYYDLFRRQVLEDLKSYGLLLSNCSSVEEIEQSGVPVESDLRLTIIGSDGRVLYDNEADSVAMGNHSSRLKITISYINILGIEILHRISEIFRGRIIFNIFCNRVT